MYDVSTIFTLLDTNNIKYNLYRHKPLASAQDMDLMPSMQGRVVKNLVLTNKQHDLYLYTLPLDERADLKGLAKALNSSRLSFGSLSDLAFLGIPQGMVSPLCLCNDLNFEFTYIQSQSLDAFDLLNCHPMSNTMSIDIKRSDLEALIVKTGHKILKINASK